MPNVLIRDVPPDVHRKLTQRAAIQGRSLQSYLQMEFERMARAETADEVLARIRTRRGGRIGFDVAVTDIQEARSKP